MFDPFRKMIRLSTTFTLLLAFRWTSFVLSQEAEANTQNLAVRTIEDGGFGCKTNLYSWSMESFKDQLYIGTLNIKGKALGMNLFLFGQPVFTSGGQVHRGTRASDGTWTWETVLSEGLTTKKNYGIRKLITIGDYLYGVTGNHETGFEVLQTSDGDTWTSVNEPGFGNVKNTSGRGMASFKGYLYIGVENRSEGAQVWRHKIETDGSLSTDSDWEQVLENGIDDDNNTWFSDFLVYNDGDEEYMYSGTLNRENGGQLWRTNGDFWENIFREGNGNPSDTALMKLVLFNNRIYIGTMNFEEGASLLVSEDERATSFKTLFTKGNGNRNNVYMWYMIGFESRLYVGTFHQFGREEFDLFSSADPETDGFIVETDDAFGLAKNMYGIRSMTVFNNTLIIGGASNNKPTKVFEATAISA